MDKRQNNIPAVVVGLCLHGLDIVRSLSGRNIVVHALESNKNLPGIKTKLAKVHFVEDINGSGLISSLIDVAKKLKSNKKAVLFLTNDNMVSQVATQWERLDEFYTISWSDCRHKIKSLLLKSDLYEHCLHNEIKCPKSYIIKTEKDTEKAREKLKPPFIIKPIKPLSGFKVKLEESIDKVNELAKVYKSELPFIVQEWIPGDAEKLIYSLFYLEKGKDLVHFECRKLAAPFSGLGIASAIEPVDNKKVYEEALRFFRGLNLSGPVSVEFKMDSQENLWVIEPTIGRGDYWVEACIANGVNFPYIEYCHQAGMLLPEQKKQKRFIWIDVERDPMVFAELLLKKKLIFRKKLIIFPYFSFTDIKPFIKFVIILTQRIFKGISKRMMSLAK
jgi:D-aspartate ligase